ncbi:MAG: DUF488 domain-containing protein, partial [Gammaproteobacteria bacterium]|nr:DUF488 domain-containing protein [Gammaproteobacteria bacterium]
LLGHSCLKIKQDTVDYLVKIESAQPPLAGQFWIGANTQFNRESLERLLEAHAITYVFLGEELGGRPENSALYLDGKVQYEWVALTEAFQFGIARVVHGAEEFTLALMCAEKDPAGCHRARLVAPALVREGVVVRHILADGTIESHEEVVQRMGG